MLALCLAGLYAVIAAASLRHVQADWSRPQGVPADAALAFCLCLGPVCMAFVTAEEETPRISPGTAAASALLPAVPAFLTAACLSPELARQEPLPFLTLTKSLSVLSVMQRFELLLSVAQLLGLFALLTMLVCAAERMLGAVRRKMAREAPEVCSACWHLAEAFWRTGCRSGAGLWERLYFGVSCRY